MELNTQKEEFSYSYIQAIASAAGYAFQRATTPLDQAGIDATITGVGARGAMGFPQLFVQVKCIAVAIEVRTVLIVQSLEATEFVLSTQYSALSTLLYLKRCT